MEGKERSGKLKIPNPETPKSSKKRVSKKQKQQKQKQQKQSGAKQGKKFIIAVPTNNKPRLADGIGDYEHIMRKHNFLSSTNAVMTQIFKLHKYDGEKAKFNTYISEEEPTCVSTIMKFTLKIMQSNPLSVSWSMALWDISQTDLLPDNCYVTFTRVFERRDDMMVQKKVKRRRLLATLSSDNKENIKRQRKAVSHDESLLTAVETGDAVVTFGAEAIVTAPDPETLEECVTIIKNYINANDETRGASYAIDIGKQNRPYLIYAPDEVAGNKDLLLDMTSEDAGISSLFVDSGGDRTKGSEYMGLSVGKLIKAYAAYSFKNHVSLFIGNDVREGTPTMGGTVPDSSQIYLSKVASRAYLLSGQNVVHFVADDPKEVEELMDLDIDPAKKVACNVSEGKLNILESIDDGKEEHESIDRLLSRFPMHINNIITLLSQFRDKNSVSLSDDFANIVRDIMVDFFVTNKYWTYQARTHPEDVRLFGYHDKYKTLADFGQYVQERMSASNFKDEAQKQALSELNTIINRNILPTIPSLDTHTDHIIDDLVKAPYRVVDLTGMSAGARSAVSNPSLNVMMLAYLNTLLPTLSNGDCIVIHGISKMSSIASTIKTMIQTSGINLDVIYTEKNQMGALDMIKATSDRIEQTDEDTGRLVEVLKPQILDFTVVDLYQNRVDKLIDQLQMDKNWVDQLRKNKASFFIKTEEGVDYVYLDRIL